MKRYLVCWILLVSTMALPTAIWGEGATVEHGPIRPTMPQNVGGRLGGGRSGVTQEVDPPVTPTPPSRSGRSGGGPGGVGVSPPVAPNRADATWEQRQNDNLLAIIKMQLKNDENELTKVLKVETDKNMDAQEKIQYRIAYIKAKMEKDSKPNP